MTKPRRHSRAEIAAYLRSMAQRERELAVEFDQQAARYEDPVEVEADAGHTWRIAVELRGSSSVVGDEHHRDAPTFDRLEVVEVRAWNLRAALAAAAALPLSAYFPEDDEA